jgi:hypothetical protein
LFDLPLILFLGFYIIIWSSFTALGAYSDGCNNNRGGLFRPPWYFILFYFGLTCVRTCIFPLTLIYQADSMSPLGTYILLWTNIRATSISWTQKHGTKSDR